MSRNRLVRSGEIVTGPPGSGKSTYVNNRRAIGDFVWDFDEVQRTVFNLGMHVLPDDTPTVLQSMLQAAIEVIDRLDERRAVWIIATDLNRANQLARKLGLRLEVMKTDEPTCLARIKDRPEEARQRSVIRSWFQQYGKPAS